MAAVKKIPKPLESFRGSLLLVGAGKMGGAMLDGWLSRGLWPQAVTVLEPQPSSRVNMVVRRGVKLNAEAGKSPACCRRRP